MLKISQERYRLTEPDVGQESQSIQKQISVEISNLRFLFYSGIVWNKLKWLPILKGLTPDRIGCTYPEYNWHLILKISKIRNVFNILIQS